MSALQRLRKSGRRLILVSGRELPDLLSTFPRADLFDRMVLENGALLYDPSTKNAPQLAPAASPSFIQRVQQAGIPISIGRSVVATVEQHEHAVLSAIRDLGLEWHVIFNKGSVMALPSGVTKATAGFAISSPFTSAGSVWVLPLFPGDPAGSYPITPSIAL